MSPGFQIRLLGTSAALRVKGAPADSVIIHSPIVWFIFMRDLQNDSGDISLDLQNRKALF